MPPGHRSPTLDFMVIALPRSGSSWASNWLSTGMTRCIHDPLYTSHYEDWDATLTHPLWPSGVSCTGIWRWTDWVNAHPARKVVLHRPLDEINVSLSRCGFRERMSEYDAAVLDQVRATHVDWTDLFEPETAEPIWRHLTGLPFDEARHRELVQLRVSPAFDRVRVDAALQHRLDRALQRRRSA